MAGASNQFSASTSKLGLFSFFSPSAISTIKSAGHFLFSNHASSVSMFTNFGLAHNKRQQSDSAKLSPFVLFAQKPPFLPRRCAGRYIFSTFEVIMKISEIQISWKNMDTQQYKNMDTQR